MHASQPIGAYVCNLGQDAEASQQLGNLMRTASTRSITVRVDDFVVNSDVDTKDPERIGAAQGLPRRHKTLRFGVEAFQHRDEICTMEPQGRADNDCLATRSEYDVKDLSSVVRNTSSSSTTKSDVHRQWLGVDSTPPKLQPYHSNSQNWRLTIISGLHIPQSFTADPIFTVLHTLTATII